MRYVKRTVSESFKDHRPAMVPEIPAAVRAAEIRARLAQLREEPAPRPYEITLSREDME